MAEPTIATPDTAVLWTRPSAPVPTWSAGPRVPVVVGPVYFLYGGASVWTLVR
jgi:hypothetical protein